MLSEEDRYAAETVKQGNRELNPGYEVPIPWKPNQPRLGKNRQVAHQRLNGLMKKFAKEPDYEKTYRIAVRKYVNKGYAEKITDNTELDPPKQWFLPHHGVYKKQLRRSLG